MLIQLKSDNKKLSYIIKKNPNSGLQLLSLRKGLLFNMFSKGNDQEFNSYFKEGANSISFKKNENEEFEYLNVTQFNSPYLLLSIINENFGHILKKDSEDDINGLYKNEILLSNIYIGRIFILDIFKRYFKDIEIITNKIHENNNKNYSIIIKTNRSIGDLIRFTFLFGAFLCIFSEEETFLDDGFVLKIFNISKYLNSAYFINYLLIKTFVKSKKLFNDVTNIINSDKINYTFGGNEFQRIDKITNLLALNRNIKNSSILDIGCGEGKYLFGLNKSVSKYYAIDIDEFIINDLKNKVGRKLIDNVEIHNGISNFIDSYNNEETLDILLVEVIEHIDYNNGIDLLNIIKEKINFRKLILSTPNKDFNIHYSMDEGKLRHEDHKFELNKLEFHEYIKKHFNDKEYKLEFFDIGDSINGVYTTSGVIISKK